MLGYGNKLEMKISNFQFQIINQGFNALIFKNLTLSLLFEEREKGI